MPPAIGIYFLGIFCLLSNPQEEYSLLRKRKSTATPRCNMKEQENMVNVTVIWRGNKFMVAMNSDAYLKELGDELQKLTDVKADSMRVIVRQLSGKGSRMLQPFLDEHSCLSLQEASVFMGKSVRMMGVTEDEVDRVIKNSRLDLRIAGFNEEERRLRQRMLDGPHAWIKLPQGPYIFCDFLILQIPVVELHPPASEALKRMHMLASDPEIVAIMNKHQWRVGIMTEMAAVGYIGVSPKCILGFNKNHGEEISLRLRTDDLNGFRKYKSTKKTLLHELAHMVFSEHDSNFYALDKQLNEEAAGLDWTKSRGATLSGIRHLENYEDGRSSHKVGGSISTLLENARASSVAAAHCRLVNASNNNIEASETHEEPDPDDTGSNMHDRREGLDIRSLIRAQGKLAHEPDPDDHCSNQNKFEPDPDDCQHGETLQLKHHSEFTKNNSQKTLGKFAAMTSSEEPDPDDSGASPCFGNEVEPDPDDHCSNQNKFEPDPDDCQHGETLQLKHHSEFTKDNSQKTLGKFAAMSSSEEPDPDGSRASSSFGNEVEPLVIEIPDTKVQTSEIIDEPDPDEGEAQWNILGYVARHDPSHYITTETLEDQAHFNQVHKELDSDETKANETHFNQAHKEPDPDETKANETDFNQAHKEPDPDETKANETHFNQALKEPDPDETNANEIAEAEPHPDDKLLPRLGISDMKIYEPDPDDQELQRIQDSVTDVCSRLRKAIEMLQAEVNPTEATIVLQTLFKMTRNVIEHPHDMKFRRLWETNPIIQRNIASYRAAMEVLFIGFSENVILDEIGKAKTYLVLKQNDPGRLWLAETSLETCIAY